MRPRGPRGMRRGDPPTLGVTHEVDAIERRRIEGFVQPARQVVTVRKRGDLDAPARGPHRVQRNRRVALRHRADQAVPWMVYEVFTALAR